MTFISFIYRIGNNKKTYYGKYVTSYISDDHEGLDYEIRPHLVQGINKFRKNNNLPKNKLKIKIGIISFSRDEIIPTYSSENEIESFDFYCIESGYQDKKIYINGKLL